MKISVTLLVLFALLLQRVVAEDSLHANGQALATAQSFTLAVLPDTQFYCDTRLKLSKKWGNGDLRRYFFDQTQWVKDNHKRLNIAFLVHEGDIVQADAPEEWAIAKEACLYWMATYPTAFAWEITTWGFKNRTTSTAGTSP